MSLILLVSACDFNQLEACHIGDIHVFPLFAGVYIGAGREDGTAMDVA